MIILSGRNPDNLIFQLRWKSAPGFFDGGVEFGKSGFYFRQVFARAGCERFHFSNIAAGNCFENGWSIRRYRSG
jgi:hypothetical protein